MANRTMQQKSLKLRRQKRAWAKPLLRSSGITPNRGVLQEYKQRACGLGVSEFEVDELIRTLYNREPIHGTAAGRAEVIQVMARLKKIVPEMNFFVIHDNCYQRTVVFFNSEKTCWVVAHTDKRLGITKTSLEYGDKERALSRFYSDKIVWVSFEEISQSQPR